MKHNMTRHRHPLRRWLKARGQSQGQFARSMGVSDAVISGVLTRSIVISLELAIRLSLATGLPLDLFAQKPATRLLKLYVERQSTPSNIVEETSNVA